MIMTSNNHPFAERGKSRLDKMGAASTVFKAKIGSAKEDPRKVVNTTITNVTKHRDALKLMGKTERENDVKAWDTAIAPLDTDWDAFEGDLKANWKSFSNKTSA